MQGCEDDRAQVFHLATRPLNAMYCNFYVQFSCFPSCPWLSPLISSAPAASPWQQFSSPLTVFLISCGLGNRDRGLFEVYILLKMNSK